MNRTHRQSRSRMPLEYRHKAPMATAADRSECKKAFRRLGLAAVLRVRRLPSYKRKRVYALAAFAMQVFSWAGYRKPGDPSERQRALLSYRNQFLRGMDGVTPTASTLRAFCDVALEASLSLEEPLRFIDAVERDSHVFRYKTYDELDAFLDDCSSSLALMLYDLLDVPFDPMMVKALCDLGKGIQLTHLLCDVGREIRAGRICLPVEDLKRFSGSEDGILREEVTRTYSRLMRFEIERARNLFLDGQLTLSILPYPTFAMVQWARAVHWRMLDRIERRGYDVFKRQIRTTAFDQIALATRILFGCD